MNGEHVEIERLALRLHGLHSRDAEMVARLVADGLAAEPGLLGGPGVKAKVIAQGAPEEVARAILVELRRQVAIDR